MSDCSTLKFDIEFMGKKFDVEFEPKNNDVYVGGIAVNSELEFLMSDVALLIRLHLESGLYPGYLLSNARRDVSGQPLSPIGKILSHISNI